MRVRTAIKLIIGALISCLVVGVYIHHENELNVRNFEDRFEYEISLLEGFVSDIKGGATISQSEKIEEIKSKFIGRDKILYVSIELGGEKYLLVRDKYNRFSTFFSHNYFTKVARPSKAWIDGGPLKAWSYKRWVGSDRFEIRAIDQIVDQQ